MMKDGVRHSERRVQYSAVGRRCARQLKASHSLQVSSDGDTYERFEI